MTRTELSHQRILEIGSLLPAVRHVPTTLQLFRYSAATWNSHRIHYDSAYAAEEGYPNVLVQSHLHGAFLTKFCVDWAGEDGRLLEISLTVRRFAVPGDVLVIEGMITDVEHDIHGQTVSIALTEKNDSTQLECATGYAMVAFKAGKRGPS